MSKRGGGANHPAPAISSHAASRAPAGGAAPASDADINRRKLALLLSELICQGVITSVEAAQVRSFARAAEENLAALEFLFGFAEFDERATRIQSVASADVVAEEMRSFLGG